MVDLADGRGDDDVDKALAGEIHVVSPAFVAVDREMRIAVDEVYRSALAGPEAQGVPAPARRSAGKP
jgi:hypothetical protein